MKYYIGITDLDWYSYLANLKPDEVNFWRPGTPRGFHAIEPGAPFLFKLHAPNNFIVGGGFLVRHSSLPLSLAWKAFGNKNGASTYEDFYDLISKHRTDKETVDPVIGCTILGEPFFWPQNQWLPAPEDWSPNLVQGRTFDTSINAENLFWKKVEQKLQNSPDKSISNIAEEAPRYGEALLKIRLGQGGFRVLVTEAYDRKCAITGEKTLPVLEAAHIKPYALNGPHATNNGLLLRSDLHTLFDLGYMTITPDYHVEISNRIKKEFENGRDYYKLHGNKLITIPHMPSDKPYSEYLEWHNQKRFVA
jgi:putative restriction endonuclease